MPHLQQALAVGCNQELTNNQNMNYPFFLKPNGVDDVLNGKYLERLTTLPKKPVQPYLDTSFELKDKFILTFVPF